MTEKSAPGLVVAARAVVAYASPIQHIIEYHSENSQTFQVAGYFVPEEKSNRQLTERQRIIRSRQLICEYCGEGDDPQGKGPVVIPWGGGPKQAAHRDCPFEFEPKP